MSSFSFIFKTITVLQKDTTSMIKFVSDVRRGHDRTHVW